MRKVLLTLLVLGTVFLTGHSWCLVENTNNSSASGKEIIQSPAYPLGVYWSWERTGWIAKNSQQDKWTLTQSLMKGLARRQGVNTLWVVNIPDDDLIQFCRLAEKCQLSVLALPEAACQWRKNKYQESPEKVAEQIYATLGNLPSLSGYVLADEPEAAEMGYMESLRKSLAHKDPFRSSLTVTPRRNLDAMGYQTQLPVLALDVYPFFGEGNPHGPNAMDTSIRYYRHWLEKLKNRADSQQRIPWIMPQGFEETYGPWHYDKKRNVVYEKGAFLQWRMPHPDEIEWQFWESLRAGMKGVIYFSLLPVPNNRDSRQSPGDDSPVSSHFIQPGWPILSEESVSREGTGLLSIHGKETETMKRLGELYRKASPWQRELASMKKISPQIQVEAPFTSASFQDPETGKTILIILNDDLKNPQKGTGIINSGSPQYKTLFTRKGTIHFKKMTPDISSFRITLPPGGGICLMSR